MTQGSSNPTGERVRGWGYYVGFHEPLEPCMPAYHEFDVSLVGVKPRIRRRFVLRATATFADLHRAIQDACGWQDRHLFAFRDRTDSPLAGIPDKETDEPDPDARRVRLSSYFGEGKETTCMYEYDFGDAWEHEVTLRAAIKLPDRFERRLLGGARAFPPEDCGGLPGYEACVRMATQGRGPKDLREWLGDWDPEAFDLEETRREFDR